MPKAPIPSIVLRVIEDHRGEAMKEQELIVRLPLTKVCFVTMQHA